MLDSLPIAVQIAGVVATLVGVAVAFDQLSLPARLRRTQQWAQETAAVETDPERREYLDAVTNECIARLLAGVRVPAFRFLEVVWSVLFVPFVAATLAAGDSSAGEKWVSWVTCFVALTLVMRSGERRYRRRQNVARDFLGRDRIPSPRRWLAWPVPAVFAFLLVSSGVAVGMGDWGFAVLQVPLVIVMSTFWRQYNLNGPDH